MQVTSRQCAGRFPEVCRTWSAKQKCGTEWYSSWALSILPGHFEAEFTTDGDNVTTQVTALMIQVTMNNDTRESQEAHDNSHVPSVEPNNLRPCTYIL